MFNRQSHNKRSQQIVKGLETVPKASFQPFSAFKDYSYDDIHRVMALLPLILVILVNYFVQLPLLIQIVIQQFDSGELELPPGVTLEIIIDIIVIQSMFLIPLATLILWLSMAGVTYFLCKLLGQEIPFSPLLTLTAFALLPDFWSNLPIAAVFLIDVEQGYQLYISIIYRTLSLLIILWRSIIHTGVIRCLSEMSLKRSFVIALLSQIIIYMVLQLGVPT